MATTFSELSRDSADPVRTFSSSSVSSGHQPCHMYTTEPASNRKRATSHMTHTLHTTEPASTRKRGQVIWWTHYSALSKKGTTWHTLASSNSPLLSLYLCKPRDETFTSYLTSWSLPNYKIYFTLTLPIMDLHTTCTVSSIWLFNSLMNDDHEYWIPGCGAV